MAKQRLPGQLVYIYICSLYVHWLIYIFFLLCIYIKSYQFSHSFHVFVCVCVCIYNCFCVVFANSNNYLLESFILTVFERCLYNTWNISLLITESLSK
jgi:hypothetical protein